MKLDVKEFQEHVNAMTDDEVRESLRQAGQSDTHKGLMKFHYTYETINHDKGEGEIMAKDFSEVTDYIHEIAGAFVILLNLRPLK